MLLEDIEAKLVAAGVVGGTTGWAFFKSFIPDSPDKAIVAFETGGEPPDYQGGAFVYPRFQIRVRGGARGYQAARVKWQEAFEVLHDGTLIDGNSSPPGAYVFCFAIQSGPIPLGDDGNDRPSLAVNFRTMRER